MTMAELTPFQTIGPYFAIAMPHPGRQVLATEATEGEPIRIVGTVLDGAGEPVPDAIIETWQADATGGFGEGADGFVGFGRIPTDEAGRFGLGTIRPGRVAGPGGLPQAPHLVVSVMLRGLLGRLVARIYFEGEPANDQDPILALVPPERRSTLIARRVGPGEYRFDIRLQGAGETVFFDV